MEGASKVEYVFALYGAVVLRVFKIKPNKVKSFISNDHSSAPSEPREGRQDEIVFLERVACSIKEIEASGIRKKEEKKKKLLELDELIEDYEKYRRRDKIFKDAYKQSIKGYINTILKRERNGEVYSPTKELTARIKELIENIDEWDKKKAEELFNIIDCVNHAELRKKWVVNEMSNYLSRSYFADDDCLHDDKEEKELAEKFENKCLKKTIEDKKTHTNIEVDLTDQNPVVYGKSFVVEKTK